MAAPKLRFKEFDGDWSSVSLLEISTLITKGTTPKQFIEGNINFLKIEAITQNGFDLSKCQTISDEINNKELKRSVLMEGDILFAIAGATIGKNAIVQKELLPANTNQALAIIRLKENYSKIFISKVLNSPLMEKYIDINISTGAQPNLNLQQIGSFSFALPKLEEQTKIASFLSNVDEKINQLTQKHALLSQYKQGMMQKLFSQQVRFKADDGSEFGEWEETTLKDCVTSIDSGWSPQCESYSTDLNEWGVLKTTSVDWKGFNASFNKKLPDQLTPRLELEVQPLDILVTRAGPTDRVGVVSIVPENVRSKLMISDKLIRLKTNEKNNPTFLGISLSSVKCQNQLQSKTSGLAKSQTNISQKILGDVVLKLPSKEEQTKIANFLSSIDQKIEVVVQQIEQAKQWKKGLLQQMFV